MLLFSAGSLGLFCFPHQAIAYMGDDFMFQLFGKYRDMALAVKNPCHLNMAACLIKLKRYEEAIGQCTIVSLCRTLVIFFLLNLCLTLAIFGRFINMCIILFFYFLFF